jgi:hypothetical protein
MLKHIENEASAEDITIETFSRNFDKRHILLVWHDGMVILVTACVEGS